MFPVWPETHWIPLIEISLFEKVVKKGSFFLQNDALIAIFIVKGREAVFWKACDELCRVVGSEKTRIRKITRKKAKKKKWFLVSNLPLCFRPNPETWVPPFHVGHTRVSWFGLNCTDTLSSRSCGKMSLFYPCAWIPWTLVKNRVVTVFWISTSRKVQAKPLNTSRTF